MPTTEPATAAVDLDEHVRRLVDGAPPLGAEQRDRLAVLLRPAPHENGGREAA